MTPSIMVHQGVRRLGLFNAFYESAVTFNSIGFRVVVGVMGLIPAEAVAIVTTLEFILNGLLEVPMGYVGDRFGRVGSTIVGIFLIMLALACIYAALLTDNPQVKVLLIYLDGVLLGFAKPLISGSMHAYYEDAIRHYAGSDPTLNEQIVNSFTKSSQFGRFVPLIATVAAVLALYSLASWWSVEHIFIIGIGIYVYVAYRVLVDARFFGYRQEVPQKGAMRTLLPIFLHSRAARFAVFLRVAFYMLGVVIAGYMIVSLLRLVNQSSPYFWPMLISFAIAYALAPVLRGYLLTPLHRRLGQQRYVRSLLWVQALAAFSMVGVVATQSLLALTIAVFFYTLCFFVTYGALGLISIDILNPVVDSTYRATALSVLNIPAFIGVGLYSSYLVQWRGGAPEVAEMYATAAGIALLSYILLRIFQRPQRAQ